MSKTPIEILLDGVTLDPVEPPDDRNDLPYPTHEGILSIAGVDLHVLVLNTGQRIIPAEDMDALFFALGNTAEATSDPTGAGNG